jgi:hypothetical protein
MLEPIAWRVAFVDSARGYRSIRALALAALLAIGAGPRLRPAAGQHSARTAGRLLRSSSSPRVGSSMPVREADSWPIRTARARFTRRRRGASSGPTMQVVIGPSFSG